MDKQALRKLFSSGAGKQLLEHMAGKVAELRDVAQLRDVPADQLAVEARALVLAHDKLVEIVSGLDGEDENTSDTGDDHGL